MSAGACKEIICKDKALAVIDILRDLINVDVKSMAEKELELSIRKSEKVLEVVEPLIFEVDALE